MYLTLEKKKRTIYLTNFDKVKKNSSKKEELKKGLKKPEEKKKTSN